MFRIPTVRFITVALLLLASTLGWGRPVAAAEPFALRDRDLVVFLGNTFVEREQLSGYVELMMTRRDPNLNVRFRNLGWSGDTVWGEARAGFGRPADGYAELLAKVREAQPTVIVIAYGQNESFDGPSGVERFRVGLKKLLDDLAPLRARFVLLSPLRQERLGPPWPDPAQNNTNLALYREVVAQTAQERKTGFVDFFQDFPEGSATTNNTTDNGVHLSPYGYWRAALYWERAWGWPRAVWSVRLQTAAPAEVSGTALKDVSVSATEVRFTALDDLLATPLPAPVVLAASAPNRQPDPTPSGLRKVTSNTEPGPVGGPDGALAERLLQVRGLEQGDYELTIDDEKILRATAQDWDRGVLLPNSPERRQTEALRQLILKKNETFFFFFRPQNWTYLFGFRKGEQGQNAVEIPRFEPLIADLETQIAALKRPLPHRYVLRRAGPPEPR